MKIPVLQAALPFALASMSAAAAPQPFSASYTGTAQVVEVLNPTGPVLRFETLAAGTGAFDLGSYFSTDVIDMSTGAGTGTNRFVAGNGDELFGAFSVQVIPTAVPNIVELLGQATFTGGTGQFSGATGSAAFTGSGVFTSQTVATATLNYSGSIALVPEPASGLLMLGGLAMAAPLVRRLNKNA
ncbi:MAG: hypothetical protein IV092_13265 [Burkholderiaceae bacterium]|nr:hypothetical protein [Burkholderiaceae bacterium]